MKLQTNQIEFFNTIILDYILPQRLNHCLLFCIYHIVQLSKNKWEGTHDLYFWDNWQCLLKFGFKFKNKDWISLIHGTDHFIHTENLLNGMGIRCQKKKKGEKSVSFGSNEILPCYFIPIFCHSLQSMKWVWANLNELNHRLDFFDTLKLQHAFNSTKALDFLKTFMKTLRQI